MREYDTTDAMIFGAILGDGWLSVKKSKTTSYQCGFSGDLGGIKEIKRDLIKKYGEIGKATIRTINSVSSKYNINGVTNMFVGNTKLSKILIDMGMPIGKRVEVEFLLPQWITNGNNNIKSAFLSGFYAAEGYSPKMQKNGKTLKVLGFTITKRKKLHKNFYEFIEQFKKILNDIEVEYSYKVKNTITCDENLRVDFIILNNHKNILHFMNIINPKYSYDKLIEWKSVLMYLNYKEEVLVKLDEARKETLENPDKSAISIALKYNINRSQVEKWRYRRSGVGIPSSFPKYKDYKQSNFVPLLGDK